ncbi:DMT family transporter [Pelosinus baikalensis]|uniref:DMT family transporter n=1 Tax=Pelosinus baikalensis TaxID=2892015 RepID=A0ABS8I0P6_9FIRM|nr:DMT family transporter [Pelosinus baikalensis]MCC5468032.1 DMT family transporter [Pelosinus baikalensis]
MKSGIIFAMLSSLVFSVMNALVKAVSFSIPSIEVVFFRSIIGTIMIYCMMRQSKVAFSTEGIPALTLRGILGALYMITYFYTLSKIPLVDAIILVNLSPVFVMILATIFLKEKLSKRTIFLLPIVFFGAMLTIKPFNFSSYSTDALFGVLSALLSAGAAIAIRHLSKKHHTYEIIFYFMATATLVSIPLMWNNFVAPSSLEYVYLTCIGVVSLLGQVFLTKAFTHENAVVVEVIRYIGIVFNAMWGFLFWAEVPDTLTVLGGMLIIGACIALSWKKKSSK